MSRRIWTKPFIKYNLSGDRTVAKSLERKARACVGYLFDQLMPNQKFRSQNWNLADGSTITAFVWRDALGERARVEVFAPGGGVNVTILYIGGIESGLILSNSSIFYGIPIEAGAPTIYLSDASRSYFNGSGTRFSDDSYEYIQGEYKIVTGQPLDFLDNKLAGKSNYIAEIIPKTPPMSDRDPAASLAAGYTVSYGTFNISSMYTGLMRLAVQSKMGAGKRINSLFPWGMGQIDSSTETAYLHDGLIRTQDYQYFVIRTTADCCKACRMEYSEAVQPMVDLLKSSTFSESNSDKIEAVILSTLTRYQPNPDDPSELDEYILLSGSAITPDEEGQPLAYGWKYSYGPEYKTSILRHRVVFYETHENTIGSCFEYEPTLSTVSFSFTYDENGKAIPLATCSHEEFDSWTLSGLRNPGNIIWTPKPLHDYNLIMNQEDWCGIPSGEFDIDTPIYCFYTRDSQLIQLVWYKNKLQIDSEIHLPSLATRASVCKAVSCMSMLKGTGDIRTETRGFRIGDHDATVEFGDVDNVEVWNTAVGISGAPGRDYLRTSGVATFPVTVGSARCGLITITDVGYRKIFQNRVTVNVNATKTIYNRPMENGNFIAPLSTVLIIPRLNAECAVTLTRQARTITSEATYPRKELMSQEFYDTETHVYYTDTGATEEVAEWVVTEGFRVQGNYLQESGVWESESGIYSNRYVLGDPYVTRENIQEREYTFYARTSNKEIQYEPEQGQWEIYFNPDLIPAEDIISFSMQESWSGELIYPEDGADAQSYKVINYVDSSTLEDARSHRWVGWE